MPRRCFVRNLESLYSPQSVAVFGASLREGSVGASLVRNFLRASAFSTRVFFVNPRPFTIKGHSSYPDISSLPEIPELAVLATPAPTIYPLVQELCQKGVQSLVVITAGVGQATVTVDGEQLSGKEALKRVLQRYPHVNLLGPNCFGLISPHKALDVSFSYTPSLMGSIALVSQSGGIIASAIDWAYRYQLGYSHIVSLGEQWQLSFAEVLEDLLSRQECQAIALYVEDLKDIHRFVTVARKVALHKPIVAIKPGKTTTSRKAVVSHTGSLMSEDQFYDLVFKRAGVCRLHSLQEFLLALQMLHSSFYSPHTTSLIVSNGGGVGIMGLDQLTLLSYQAVELSPVCRADLDAVLPPLWSKNNPIDIIGDASAQRYIDTLDILLRHYPEYPIFLLYVPTGTETPERLAEYLLRWLKEKKVSNIIIAWTGYAALHPILKKIAKESHVPTFETVEDAVNAFHLWHQWQDITKHEEFSLPLIADLPPAAPSQSLEQIMKIPPTTLPSTPSILELQHLLLAYQIPFIATEFCQSPQQFSQENWDQLPFPLVIKVHTHSALHKSEVGGVAINITSTQEALEAMQHMATRMQEQKIAYEGFLLQAMILPTAPQYELFLGIARDERFGHFISFGRGGVEVEVVKDTATEWTPLSLTMAENLVQRTKIYQLLKGYRNVPSLDLSPFYQIILNLSQLIIDFPQIAELDLNPLILNAQGLCVVDARAKITPSP